MSVYGFEQRKRGNKQRETNGIKKKKGENEDIFKN